MYTFYIFQVLKQEKISFQVQLEETQQRLMEYASL